MQDFLKKDILSYFERKGVRNKNLKKLLNLHFTDITNKSRNVGQYDLPYNCAKISVYPDYIALYNERNKYHATDKTCVAFYNYDQLFDGLYGIFNAIYYDINELQNFYMDRFKGVKYFISPDFSLCGDINHIENLYRVFKSRIVSVWLTLKLKAIVIPNITYSSENFFPNMLEGLEECEVVAFSTKGLRNNNKSLELMKKAIKYTADTLKNLKTIVVYTLSSDDAKIYAWFSYASKCNVDIVIANNRVRNKNSLKNVKVAV